MLPIDISHEHFLQVPEQKNDGEKTRVESEGWVVDGAMRGRQLTWSVLISRQVEHIFCLDL